MPHRNRWLLLGWCLFWAALVRWPTSLFWDTLSQDPNTPLHAMAALDLASGDASPFRLSLLGYPDGLTVRLLAWPVLLICVPFEFVFSPVVAFNLGVLVWLVLQGLGMVWLGARLGWGLSAQGVAAAAVITAPTTLRALGNGQFENLVSVAFVLGLLALLSTGRRAALLGLAAGLIAAFSSPYQGVVLGCLLGVGVLAYRPRESWPALVGGLGALGLAVFYFLGVTSGLVHLSAVPAPGVMSESASLGEVFLPVFYSPPFTTGELPAAGLAGVGETLQGLGSLPRRIEFGVHWPWVNAVPYGYAGLSLVLLGSWGLWKNRTRPVCRILLVFAVACLLLAMGSQLTLAPGVETGIPMPWAIPSQLESVGQMQATVRFLTGLTFAAAVGLGFLCTHLSRKSMAALGLLVVLDGLLLSPAHWPVRAAAPDIEQIASTLDDGPVASWPGPPHLAPRHHQTLALLLERPVAWFSGMSESSELVEADGRRIQDLEENDRGERPDQWLRRVEGSGVDVLLEFKVPEGKNVGVLFEKRSMPVCATELCAWTVSDPLPVEGEEGVPRDEDLH